MESSIKEKKVQLIDKLRQFDDKDDRLRYIIDQGRKMPPMDDKFKIDQFLVKGCISRAWLFPQFSEGRVFFKADSEALIVKGVIALLLQVFSGGKPEEIIAEDASFLGEVGVSQHLSTNRRNGLTNVLKMIHAYAAAFQQQS